MKRSLIGVLKPKGTPKKQAKEGNSNEKAAQLYRAAGNQFKMAKKWSEAGNAFSQSSRYREFIYDACMDHVEAANCYRKTKPDLAIASLIKATEIQTNMGKFQNAAKYHQEIGVIYDSMNKPLDAIEQYDKAAQLYRSELRNARANICLQKVADYAAKMADYERAIKIYEELASLALQSNLLKYSAEDHYFKAGLCHLCVDFLNAKHALARYNDECPAFILSRKGKLMFKYYKAVGVNVNPQCCVLTDDFQTFASYATF